PFTQVYLFLPQNVRKRLFIENSLAGEDYYSELEKTKSALPGFFTYDFFPVALILESLRSARNQDTADLIKTRVYGNRFRTLLDDLNSVLIGMTGKSLNVGTDLSKIIFEIHKDNQIVELYPEDMSHGELKRLSLYMWTKYHKIDDAIVLMDEIEIALHPDWQYQIVRDLMQWTPNNQYILATHSFDLCEALTPAHVKELEPKLLKRASE
ncbi:MAG: ATP-binding protein, partial [Desulfobacteraceae bacterium IS3]